MAGGEKAAAMMDAIQKAAQALAQLSDREWTQVKWDEERRRSEQCTITPSRTLRSGVGAMTDLRGRPEVPRKAETRTRQDAASSSSSLPADENLPILKMAEREDWVLFRTVEGLQQRAGVPAAWLRRLVLKELGDNALDTKTPVKSGEVEGGHFVADQGPGLDGTPEEIAELFSIRRPMRSSKLIRLPQRGALGNGLRVVAGAVLASGGWLTVITRNKRIELKPQADGSTKVIRVKPVKYPVGTRIEIGFGEALPDEDNALAWARAAKAMASAGKSYDGKSSPFWYDPAQFHELILAHGEQPLRALIAQLDGCTGGKAGEIVAAAKLDRKACADVTRQQATTLLAAARKHARAVSPERLGWIGREVIGGWYAIEHGKTFIGSSELQAEIPFVVEAWAEKISTAGNRIGLTMLVNRTPVTGQISAFRDEEKDICIFGCGLPITQPALARRPFYAPNYDVMRSRR